MAHEEKRRGTNFHARTGREPRESILVSSRLLDVVNYGSGLSTLFGTVGDRTVMETEKFHVLPDTFGYDTRVVHEARTGNYDMCINDACQKKERKRPAGPRRIIAIDPGVRAFATCYDPLAED